MLVDLTRAVGEQVETNAPWQVSKHMSSQIKRSWRAPRADLHQDIEAILHCVRYSSEAVPLGEEGNLPLLFGDAVLGRLAQRPLNGQGEERLRLTVVCMIRGSPHQCLSDRFAC